ncbi:MAG: nucleotidyltransferase family protein [Bacteroidales bacterium]|nr:nucleotidyltransferase family protein [Bacteroidales bacterium]
MMDRMFYNTSRLSKITQNSKELNAIQSFFSEIYDKPGHQQTFYQYCIQWKLAPWIWVQMNRLGLTDYLNESIKADFKGFYEKVRLENENRNREAARFLEIFTKEGIDVAILKGNLLLHTVYKDIGYKKMNDFDMLIHPADWTKVQRIYQDLGYIPLGFGWGGEKDKAAKFSHAGLSYISPNHHCITGTQWGLKSPTSKYTVPLDDLWKNTSSFTFEGVPIRQLSTPYNLLHLILHMGTFKCGIRDCMDIYNLMLADKNWDKDYFIDICRLSNAVDKAWFTLQLTNFCSDAVPSTLLEKLKPKKRSFLVRRYYSRRKMAEKTGDMQLSYNDYFHEVEMTVFYFSLIHTFHQKGYFYCRLLRQMLWPKRDVVKKLSDLTGKPGFRERLKARLKAPYMVFALIGEEIGVGVVILLFIKMFLDTIISLKNYIFKKESYFTYLKNRGINPEEIKRVVKGIQ